MAKYGPVDAWFLVDGYDLGAYLTEFNAKAEALTEESHTIGDSWQEHLPVGVRRLEVTTAGFYDDANDASNEALSGTQQTSRVVCIGVEGQTVGKKFIGAEGAYAAEFERQSTRNGLHKFSGGFRISGTVSEGVILQELEDKTADWNTEGADSVDNTTSSSSGGVGFLQVTSMSGFTGFVGKIRHSADDVTYADLITFANVTAAPDAERLTVAGTVNRHLAFNGDVTGSGTIRVFCGFARS